MSTAPGYFHRRIGAAVAAIAAVVVTSYGIADGIRPEGPHAAPSVRQQRCYDSAGEALIWPLGVNRREEGARDDARGCYWGWDPTGWGTRARSVSDDGSH